MKKNVVIGLFTMLAVFYAKANDIKIEVLKTGKRVSIVMDQIDGGAIISISDELGSLLSEVELKQPTQLGKVLNLEQLAPGKYVVLVKTAIKEVTQPVILDETGITILKSEKKEYFYPTIKLKGENLDVNFFNPSKSKVTLSILDVYGNLVFEEENPEALQILKRFDLNQLEAGQYTLAVKTAEKSHYEHFTLK